MKDFSKDILYLLNNDEVSFNINPLIKYSLKMLFDKHFKARSPRFSNSLTQYFQSINNYVEISMLKEMDNDISKQETLFIEERSSLGNFLNNDNRYNSELKSMFVIDKDKKFENNFINVDALTEFINNEWEWATDKLLEYNVEYILDSTEFNPLVELIKDYLFSKEDPKHSKLLISYSLIASSIELIFCLQLLLKFPTIIMQNKESEIYFQSQSQIKQRLNKFIYQWKELYGHKLKNNPILRKYSTMNFSPSEDQSSHGYIDLIEMTKEEPLLKKNFIVFSRIIQEGIFIFEVEEIAKQICLIDQSYISEITINNYLNYFNNKEDQLFNKILLREKQLKVYILFFIFLITCIQVRKNIIEKFIELAYCLKRKKNYQTYVTIIKTFLFINLKDKVSLWDQLDNKYKTYYLNMVNEINSIEMNEGLYNSKGKRHSSNTTSNNLIIDMNDSSTILPIIPNIFSLNLSLEIIKRKAKKLNNEEQLEACQDFKDFYLGIVELKRNKFPYYENNPLYDFLKFGFKELFRTNIWRPQFKKYSLLRPLIEDYNKIDKILEHLDDKFKKIDSK